jgi:hypothetical protein
MLLVLGDSTCFHGPERAELLTESRLFANVAAAHLGMRAEIVAGAGWMSRDGWWAVSRDPRVWTLLDDSELQAVALMLGSMDQLPASVPIVLRESIRYVRPAAARRRVRDAYHRTHPFVVRGTAGSFRQLNQSATDHYLSRILGAVRHYRPEADVVLLGPAPWKSESYPQTRGHAAAVEAATQWCARHEVGHLDLDPIVGAMLADGRGNPDGLHWDWPTHREVGEALARLLLERF